MGRWDNLCVSMKLHPRQELAFERSEYFIGLVVVEAQDAAVGLVRREEIPVLGNQRFALPVVCEHSGNALSNIGKQAAFYAAKAGEKVIFLPVSEVAVEVNYLLRQQFMLRRGSAFQLPLTSVLSCIQQLRNAPRGVIPGHKVHVALIASRIALGYAYPIRVHPRRVVLSVHADANATAINRRQERGYLVK